jgi:hypothetical protein
MNEKGELFGEGPAGGWKVKEDSWEMNMIEVHYMYA